MRLLLPAEEPAILFKTNAARFAPTAQYTCPPSTLGQTKRGIQALFISRWPIFLARAITLAGFLLTILAGLFGSVVGSHNFSIIFVWIAWWTLLKLVFIPLGGRSWCAICPVPMPGEWLAQRSIFPGGKRFSLGIHWPRRLGPIRMDGTWLQASGFLLVGLFSAVTLTTPRMTGWVLLGILLLATGMALIFEPRDLTKLGEPRRAFCNHLCPIGGFTGLYAQAAPVEVRVRDRAVCAAHAEKTCFQECPWGVYVAGLPDNASCGMCFECLRVCPNDNVSVSLRAFGKDYITSRSLPSLDEAYLALVMLGCALSFSAVFLGSWGWLRNAAYNLGSTDWLLYGAGFLVFAGLLVPGLYALAVGAASKVACGIAGGRGGLKKTLARSARPLLPLGMCAWIAFTISFALAKAAYILPVLSDPFGRGWNLLGLANTAASVSVPAVVAVVSPVLQVIILLGGLLWMNVIARKDSPPHIALVVQAFGLVITIGMLVLLVG